MTTEFVSKIIWAAGGVMVTVLFATIAFFLRQSLTELRKLSEKVNDLKIELVKDYVRTTECEKDRAAHKELREGLTSVRERLAVVEATYETKR